MPNWCLTSYVITGREDEVATVYKTLTKMKERKSLLPNDWGSMWVGNIVRLLNKDWQKVYCRGWITDFEQVTPNRINLSVESAWGELDEVRQLVLMNSESLKIYYQAEEPGMCIFRTNDADGTYFPERWLLDWNDEKNNTYIWEYFQDLPAVVSYLKESGVITKDVNPTKEAINAVLSEIEEKRPESISYMLEEFVVVDD